jgi:hypothetical protein
MDEISNCSGKDLGQCKQLTEDWTMQEAVFGIIYI